MTWNATDKHSAIIEKLDNFFMMLLLEDNALCTETEKSHKWDVVSQCLPVTLYFYNNQVNP